jgi:hypothetical protein
MISTDVTESPRNEVKVQVWTVRELVDSLNGVGEKGIFIPSFQRGLVWQKKKRAELIQSVRESLPIGSLLMYYSGIRDNKPTYELVDGLQRSTSLKLYESEVFEFFQASEVDDDFVDDVLKSAKLAASGEHDYAENERRRGEVRNAVKRWVRGRRSFSAQDGFRVTGLLDEISKRLKSSEFKTSSEAIDVCQQYMERLRDELDIGSYQIPVIVFYGNRTELPEVFERLNTKGAKLSKFDILASSWSDRIVVVERRDMLEQLAERQAALRNAEIERADFQHGEGSYELFHATCALGSILVERFPRLFRKTARNDSLAPEPAGFNVLTMCFGLKVTDVKDAPTRIDSFGSLDRTVDEILKACDYVDRILAPLLAIEIETAKGVYTHTEMQIASIAASFFRALNGFDPQQAAPMARREARLVHHYLGDALRREWVGTGDTKAYRAIATDRYAEEVPRRTFEAQSESFYVDAPDTQDARGARRDPALIVFLRAIAAAQLGKADGQPITVSPVPALPNLKLIGLSPYAVANLRLLGDDGRVVADPGRVLAPLPQEPSKQQIMQRLDDRFKAMVDLICSHFAIGT